MYSNTYNKERIQEFLNGNTFLQHNFSPLDENFLKTARVLEEEIYFGEAWVPVKIIGDGDGLFSNLIGKHGIITYPNSD